MQFLIRLKHFLVQCFFSFIFIHSFCLEYSSNDEPDESNKEEYEKIGSKSGSAVTFGNRLSGLLLCVELYLCVTISDDESCDGDGGSYVNICGTGTRGYGYNECTGEVVWDVCIYDT